MNKAIFALAPLALLMSNALYATEATVEQSVQAQKAITDASYTANVKLLASDEFGGRAPGTKGEELTVNHLVSEFSALKLTPANGDSFTQSVPLTSVEVTNKPDLVFTDKQGKNVSLKYAVDQVVWTRKQQTSSALTNSDLVFVGYGINAPERNWNDYAGIDVKGKTVVMLINDPGFATQNEQLFNGNAMTYYGRWDYKFDEASKQGAAGAIMIHDTKPAAYGWPTVAASWTGPKFDMVRPDKGVDLASTEAWITKDAASALFTSSGLIIEDMYKAAQTPGFKAVPLSVKASTKLETKIGHVNSRNVAAILKGSESPDEVFIYMAHWDHIGTDPNAEGDGIYNGALDNATGTAGLVELAKAFSALKVKPKRSVMFLAVTAEEQGLLGSAYYAANPLVPLANTVGGLNMDGLNNFGRTKDMRIIGKGMSQLETFIENRTKQQGRVLIADSEPERGYFFRSDHFELAKFGVPMLYPKSGQNHIEKGTAFGKGKSQEYVENHYHGPSDEYNESWDMSGAIEDLQLFFLTGLDIANSKEWPNWHEGAEFKAARDASLKAK